MNKDYYRIDNSEIPEIRFLPMDKKNEFKTYEAAVEFLAGEMVERDGVYRYRTSSLKCKKGSLILFQYDAKLIGSISYIDNVKYEEPNIHSEKDISKGYYVFNTENLIIFDEPITAAEYFNIDNTFKNFNQSTRKTDVKYLKEVLNLIISKTKSLQNIENYELPEEIEDCDGIFEGAKKTITINAYERNRQSRQQCIDYYKKKNNGVLKCEICSFDFSKVYGDDFGHCINVHHIVELSEIGEEYNVDPVNDLLPVCPNCHMILHTRKPAYTPEEIQSFFKK